MKFLTALAACLISTSANAAEVTSIKNGLNTSAISMFVLFVGITLVITMWAARRTKSAKDFYAAGGGITGFQNGLAITGDYVSSASFLGISGLVYMSGFDGLIYAVGFIVGWPIVLFLIAEPLRNLGKFTFADVVSFRLQQKPIRIVSALGSLATVLLYLIAQIVGSGKLIQVLFGLPYEAAVIAVGVLMVLYVTFGGMLATTWVQIIKATLILAGGTTIAFLVLQPFGFSLSRMFDSAVSLHKLGDKILAPGNFVTDPVSAISLGLALIFGTAGLPHILMRFFTVADAKQARRSILYSTGFIGYFYILTFIIGFGAVVMLTNNPEYFDENGGLIGGANMAAIHLSHAVGGNILLGFISAVAFATILAVVSGLTLAGSSAISHDLYATLVLKGKRDEKKEIRVSRIATIILGIVAIFLGIIFESQNVAFMVGLAFCIAASANFPILFLSIYWKRLTTRGAVMGAAAGLGVAVVLVILGPTVWVDVLGNEQAIFPYKYPALFSITAAFICVWLFSVTDKSANAKREQAAFEEQFIRGQTGIGAEAASEH